MAKKKKSSPPLKKKNSAIATAKRKPESAPRQKNAVSPGLLACFTAIIIIIAILAYKEVISGTVSIILLIIATLAFQVFLGIKRSKNPK
mgnify:CR=1 FL=1